MKARRKLAAADHEEEEKKIDPKNDTTPSSSNVFADLGLDAPDELQAKAMLFRRSRRSPARRR